MLHLSWQCWFYSLVSSPGAVVSLPTVTKNPRARNTARIGIWIASTTRSETEKHVFEYYDRFKLNIVGAVR